VFRLPTMITTDFGDLIAERMRAEHRALAVRWFDRLLDLLPGDARSIFPTDSLLDHVPGLILEIATSLRSSDDGAIAANTAILDKARELGALRHGQRASLHQVLREYQLLEGVLVTFVLEEIERYSVVPPPSDTVRLVSRLHQAVNVLSQATVEAFVTVYNETITEQTERLQQFTRMAAHEWRQPLGALQFGIKLLQRSDLGEELLRRTLAAVERNVTHLVTLTNKLETVARMHNAADDNAVVQEVSAGIVAEEAARQLREMADARGVEVHVAERLPILTVDVGRLELALVNLLSNAIKYADPAKETRFVNVVGDDDGEGWCRVEVRDNGIGIPPEALGFIFNRFTRAHADRDESLQVRGVGLGLSIVEDCVKAMGGRIEVQSAETEGTTFIMRLPIHSGVPPQDPT
jgi:signal transduction histidine kinase